VGMYEQGRREPSAQMLLTISRVLGVSVDYLLSGTVSDQDSRKVNDMLLSRILSADRRLEDRKDRPFSREDVPRQILTEDGDHIRLPQSFPDLFERVNGPEPLIPYRECKEDDSFV